MIPGFATVLAASADDRRDLFIGAGNRLGTVQQNIEKDFWVCWTLDALFNGLQADGPRLLFAKVCVAPESVGAPLPCAIRVRRFSPPRVVLMVTS